MVITLVTIRNFSIFEKIILTRAVGSSYTFEINETDYSVMWRSPFWTIRHIELDLNSGSLTLSIEEKPGIPLSPLEGNLTVVALNTAFAGNRHAKIEGISVTADGNPISHQVVQDEIEIGLGVSIPIDTREIEIIAYRVIQDSSYSQPVSQLGNIILGISAGLSAYVVIVLLRITKQ